MRAIIALALLFTSQAWADQFEVYFHADKCPAATMCVEKFCPTMSIIVEADHLKEVSNLLNSLLIKGEPPHLNINRAAVRNLTGSDETKIKDNPSRAFTLYCPNSEIVGITIRRKYPIIAVNNCFVGNVPKSMNQAAMNCSELPEEKPAPTNTAPKKKSPW